MDICDVRNVFMWCSIINGVLLIFIFLLFSLMRDFIYQMHSKLFPISEDAFNVIIYSFISLYKILFIVFNLVPFLACSIVMQ